MSQRTAERFPSEFESSTVNRASLRGAARRPLGCDFPKLVITLSAVEVADNIVAQSQRPLRGNLGFNELCKVVGAIVSQFNLLIEVIEQPLKALLDTGPAFQKISIRQL